MLLSGPEPVPSVDYWDRRKVIGKKKLTQFLALGNEGYRQMGN